MALSEAVGKNYESILKLLDEVSETEASPERSSQP
jgi:hypothetical protein